MNSVRSNTLSLKYQLFTPSGLQDLWIRKFEFCCKNLIPFIDFINWVLNNGLSNMINQLIRF